MKKKTDKTGQNASVTAEEQVKAPDAESTGGENGVNKKVKKRRRSVITFVVGVFAVSIIITLISSWFVSMANKVVEINRESSDKARTVSDIVNDIYSNGLLVTAPKPNAGKHYPPLTEKRKLMLSSLCNSFGFKYLYLFSLNDQTDEYTYLFVVSSDDETSKMLEEKRPYGTVVHVDDIPDAVRSAAKGDTTNTFWEDDNEFGKTYGWAYPVLLDEDDGDYLVLAAEFDVDVLYHEIGIESLKISIPILIILVLNLLALLFIIRKKILDPIKTISSKMNSFASGDDISDERLNMKKNDEIGEIAQSFDKMSDDIRDYVTNINDLTTYRVQSSTQMEIAERIQYGIVPEVTELNEDALSAYAIEKPAKLIGGDFYDCFMRDDTHFCMVMGDVSGKGVTAALFMVMVKTAIREKLASGMNPAELLNVVNDEVCASNPEGLFATVFVAILDTQTGLLRYANAGHTAPVIIEGKPRFLRPDPGIAIGLFEDAGIKEKAMLLQQGTGIVLYTDGVTEAVDPDDTFYGEERLIGTLADVKTAKQATTVLRSSILGFYNGREQFDDLTILSAFFMPSDSVIFLKPETEEQDRITDLILSKAGAFKGKMKIILACEELFTNIVEYSKADSVVFGCRVIGESLCVRLLDNGVPFDPVSAEPVKKDFTEFDTGGMGISLVRQIAENVSYTRIQKYNSVSMTFELK